MTNQHTHIVVIGGGYAGTLAANHLRLRSDVEITLVNPRRVFVERIRLHQLAARSGTAAVDYGTLLGEGIRLVVDSAERIKALMFTFEDLGKLDPGSIQTLLRNVEKDKLGLALKGATDSLRDIFFSNMSERAGKILREDMEAMGPVRLKDVDEAQMRMVNVAKDLANKGEIMIANKAGEDELVY